MSSVTLSSSVASSTLTSSPLHTKLPPSNPSSFAQFSLHFLSKPFKPFLKPLKLTPTQFVVPTSLSLPHCHRAFSSSFDSFEANQSDAEAETAEFGQQEESTEEARLYVGNLPYTISSTELTEFFKEAGRVVSTEIIYDRVTDRSRGFGFVTMASVEEAKEAIRMFDGAQIGGRTAKVNFPEVPKGGEREIVRSTYKGFVDSPHKIYAGNLNWRITSQALRDAFTGQPGLLSARVVFERDSGRSRGFGFVTFESAEDAEAALNALNGVEVEGRPLRLNFAAVRQRSPVAPESDAVNVPQGSELVEETQDSPTAPETDAENHPQSSELVSSIGT